MVEVPAAGVTPEKSIVILPWILDFQIVSVIH